MSEPSYDDVPYPGYAFAETHPASLAAIAHLHGRDVPDVARARVLELGCGTGGNLIALAAALPQAQFVGIDTSSRAIAQGHAAIGALAIANVTLAVGDIMTFASATPFDFVIAHGVYSWVPEPVRRRLLALYGDVLSERGLGFLSFAAYPGGYVTAMMHAMARFHARGIAAPDAAIAAVRDLARRLAAAPAGEHPVRALLRHEARDLAGADDALIAHDVLSENHHCAWLHEVADALGALGLQFVADARPVPQAAFAGARHIEAVVSLGGDDPVRRAQYFDLARASRFRTIVIARAGAPPALRPRPDRLAGLHLRAEVAAAGAASLAAGAAVRFTTRAGAALTLDDPLAKAALLALGAAFPRALPFAELMERSVQAVRAAGAGGALPADPAAHLGEALADMLGGDLIRVATVEPPIAAAPGERPRASDLARHLLAAGRRTVNLRHETVELDEPGRRLVLLLDGTRTRGALAAALGIPRTRLDEMLAIVHRRGLLAA